MKNSNNSKLTAKLYCSLFGHNYFLSKKVTYHIKEYTCKSCKKQVTTNVNGDLIDLTPKYKEINSVLERVHNKRKLRLQNKSNVSSII
jgi:transposase-like protein